MMKYIMKRALCLMSCMVFALTVSAQQVTGDVVTTVADEGESGMYVATLCPRKDVAIDKNLAECFSIYVDMGKAYLLKMRVMGNRYVVKAGDCVIVKSVEAAAIPLENTTRKTSSVWTSDIVCPSADMSIEEFRSSYSVKEGDRIFLLTNMNSNGGFGFTKFTGDIMRRGNFFIIVSASKTRAAVDIEDGDPVPMLEGVAGNDDGFTAQSVYAKGDANGDGKVNVADVVEIVNYMTDTPTSAFLFDPADANSDGSVDTKDVEEILNIILPTK